LQNVRIAGRTVPAVASPSSPPLSALAPWVDRGDNKLTASIPIRHLDGRADVSVGGGTIELALSSPRGFTPSEVLVVKDALRLPFDASGEVSVVQLEVFRDGRDARFEGIEARTYRDVEGFILKAYNHTDSRGTLARVEIRPPRVSLSWAELEAWCMGRQPLGRDVRIERLTDMVEDLSRGVVHQRKELTFMRRALDEIRGYGIGRIRGETHVKRSERKVGG
jgi:hypothetical protein